MPLFYCGLWCHRILYFCLLCACVSAEGYMGATVCKMEASVSFCIPGKPPLENVRVQHM